MDRFSEIQAFLEREIVPRYDAFDAAHGRDHVRYVMRESQHLAQFYPQVDRAMLMVAAAYHDLGLSEGRERHHEVSARILRADRRLRQWFIPQEIEVMADAAEDHRASSKREPRTIYGRIIAESDRQIDGYVIVKRALQYGLNNNSELDREGHRRRVWQHMQDKYGHDGYLRLYIPESENAERLREFRAVLDDANRFDRLFGQVWGDVMG